MVKKVTILPNKKGTLLRVRAFNASILSGRGLLMDHSEAPSLNISVSDLVCVSCLPHPPVTRYTTVPSSAQYQAQAWLCLPWLRCGKSSIKPFRLYLVAWTSMTPPPIPPVTTT